MAHGWNERGVDRGMRHEIEESRTGTAGNQMLTSAQIQSRIREIKPDLEKRFHVKSIGLFGSAVRDEMRPDSDIDILVEFAQPVGFEYLELEDFLTETLGTKVDLVPRKAQKPLIGKRILAEVVTI